VLAAACLACPVDLLSLQGEASGGWRRLTLLAYEGLLAACDPPRDRTADGAGVENVSMCGGYPGHDGGVSLLFAVSSQRACAHQSVLCVAVPPFVQAMQYAFGFGLKSSYVEGDKVLLMPAAASFLRAVLVPTFVLREGAPPLGPPLSPEASTARRSVFLFEVPNIRETSHVLQLIGSYIGSVRGRSMREGMASVVGEMHEMMPLEFIVPADVQFMYTYVHDEGSKCRAPAWILTDAYLGPVYNKYKCSTCGLLPGEVHALFSVCSLCKDSKAGRFCSKDPCFITAWKNGHKDTCAGRDKMKKKAKGG
jgi:hypothetical protein